MSDSNDRWDKLGALCYDEALTLPVKCYNVIWTWTWIRCKRILHLLGQPLKKKKSLKRREIAKTGDKMESHKMFS